MKDIVIIANFCRDFSETDNGRFMYLCKELSKEHKVEIITSDFSHGKKVHKDSLTHKWPFKITFIHEPGYKKNISLKRFNSHFLWGREVRKYLDNREKPDVVYCAVPSLTAPNEAAKYCKEHGVRFIIDIQDLWPEAFQMVFNVPVLSKLVFAPFNWMVNKVYSSADEICAVSQTYAERAKRVNRKAPDATVAFLGTLLSQFDEYKMTPCPVEKNDNELLLAYIGTLGHSYDLTCVFDAMRVLLERNETLKLRFVVMGDGPLRSKFESYASDMDLPVHFTGKLPYPEMVSVLCKCNVAVNPIQHGSAGSIINKVGDYAMAGLPVVNTQECPEYRNLLDEYEAGINCINGSVQSLADAIEALCKDSALRKKLGEGSRRLGEEKFDRKTSYIKLVECIEGHRGNK